MKCEESLILLSELHSGELEESTATLIRQHLVECPPCDGIFKDIQTIVMTASALRQESDALEFPDENVIWQRLTLIKQTRQVQ